ncbi:holliday junction DNA helicase RuvA [Lachnospiraceae bacterium KM106-2]|nr:holliday junction DNA helicase RuvA [Lachnospiraceae bacterium KM106-2]
MISYIKGELIDVSEESIVIECNSIGYEIKVPYSVVEALPNIGDTVRIHTYMYVREDALALYGFLTKDSLKVFKLLITVNGIGPKAALGILSTISTDDLRFAVLAGDAKTIAKAPGIGAKTASKLILELKDKLDLEETLEHSIQSKQVETTEQVTLNLEGGVTAEANVASVRADAVAALVALGYSSTDAMKMVRQVTITKDMDVESVLKLSLKNISIL